MQAATRTLAISVAPAAPVGPGDFAYLGSYRQPDQGVWYARLHIAFRRVGGQRRLLQATGSGTNVKEFSLAAEPVAGTTEASLPLPPLVTAYDTLCGAKKPPTPPSTTGSAEIWGIHWDEETQRLYWNGCADYVTSSVPPSWPHFGYSTLSGGTATAFGPWGVASGIVSQRSVTNGCATLPAAFADAHCQGRRLALGFGGYHSINAQVCAGLALAAVEHPDPAAVAEGGAYPATRLSEYGIYASSGASRPRRSGGYASLSEPGASYQPDGTGEGRWTPDMSVYGAGCWLDLPDGRSGMLLLSNEGKGDIAYHQTGYYAAGGMSHAWHWWDAAGLAAVASGAQDRLSLPHSHWQVRYPEWAASGGQHFRYDFDQVAGLYATPAGSNSQRWRTVSACFDPVERRLYAVQQFAFDWNKRSVIHVYQAGGA